VWPSAFNCSNKFRHQGINVPRLIDYCTNSLLLVIAQYTRFQLSPLACHPVMQLFLARKSRLRLPQPLHAPLQLYTLNTLTLQCLLLPYAHLISASARWPKCQFIQEALRNAACSPTTNCIQNKAKKDVGQRFVGILAQSWCRNEGRE